MNFFKNHGYEVGIWIWTFWINGEMAVGLWNFCIDSILAPEITLSKKYKKIKFINCKGKMKGDKVYLSEIAPFGFAGIVLR